jgi:hypothetical protein
MKESPQSKPGGSGSAGDRTLTIRAFRALNKNTLQGVFSATLPSGLIIHDLLLHEQEGHRWIGVPAKEYLDKNGARHFTPILGFTSRQLADRFQSTVLAALDDYLAHNPGAREERP